MASQEEVRLPPERTGHAAPDEVLATRRQIAQGVQAGLWKVARPPSPVIVGGCEALHFQPAKGATRAVLLALHGGGFRQGAPEIGSAFYAALADRCGASVFALRYRLAPDHPFPAGLADGWQALRAVGCEHTGLPILVCGDSAGGGLAAGLGILAKQDAETRLDGVILLSPWLDLTVTAAAYASNAATDPLFSRAMAVAAANLYLQGESPEHPLASPLHADLRGYPPTLVTVGSGEVLRDDSVAFAAKLRSNGVASRLEIIEGMDHVAVTRGLSLPGSAACFEHVVGFIDGVIASEGEAP